ncbi:hypothetical protein L1887_16398 [Cichorium endivia]|nr:hypothetical protein L1887_16398 [Cichorium endivia]
MEQRYYFRRRTSFVDTSVLFENLIIDQELYTVLEDEEPDPDFLLPKAIPKSYSNLGEDVIYLKIVGPSREPEEVETDSPEAVRKILFRFRNKELHRICGTEDARILNIQTASRATIGILSDTASRLHRHLYLELLGTANEVKIADLLITDVITEIQVFMRALEKYPFHSYGLIDAPKILVDIVESTIGAICVDSNSSIDTTWELSGSIKLTSSQVMLLSLLRPPVWLIYMI